MRVFAAVVLACACGGSPAAVEPTPPAGAAAPTCARVAGHMADLVAAGIDPPPPDAEVNALIALIRTRCEDDGWTAEARRCLGTMQTAVDADRCGTLLTEAQLAALVRDQEQRLGGASEPTPEGNPAAQPSP